MIVDYQSHWYPPACLEALIGRRKGYPRTELVDGRYALEASPGRPYSFGGALTRAFVEVEEQLRLADEVGVDMLVSSPAGLGEVWDMDPSEAEQFLELAHTQLAQKQREFPQRFRGLAMLPLHAPERAARVLERAVEVHDLRGICMLASIGQEPIATPEMLPVFQHIERLDLPIFLHPTPRSFTSDRFEGSLVEGGLGWMFHTSVAALQLITSGTLDACPRLTVVHPHLGGTLPYALGRLDRIAMNAGITMPVSRYLRERFYTDTVNTTPGALRMAIDTYGIDRILFATDVPFENMRTVRAAIEANATATEADAILTRNTVGRLIA